MLGRTSPGPAGSGLVRGGGGLGQVKQVGPFGLVELKGSGEGLQDSVGNSAEISSFKPCVVFGADAGEHGHFLAFEAGYPAGPAVEGSPAWAGVMRDRRLMRNSRMSWLLSMAQGYGGRACSNRNCQYTAQQVLPRTGWDWFS